MVNFKNTKTAKNIKERWTGKDMETYFQDKSKRYLQELKDSLK